MHKINDDLSGVLSDALLLTKAAELAQELGIHLSTSSLNPVPVTSTANSSQPVAAPPSVSSQPCQWQPHPQLVANRSGGSRISGRGGGSNNYIHKRGGYWTAS